MKGVYRMALVYRKQPGRPGKRPASDEELLKLYETRTATEIAAVYDVKPATVRGWISEIRKEVGVDNKQSGRPAKRPASDEELLKLYETHTATEVAAMYGVKPATVRAWASKIRKVVEANAAEQ